MTDRPYAAPAMATAGSSNARDDPAGGDPGADAPVGRSVPEGGNDPSVGAVPVGRSGPSGTAPVGRGVPFGGGTVAPAEDGR